MIGQSMLKYIHRYLSTSINNIYKKDKLQIVLFNLTPWVILSMYTVKLRGKIRLNFT